MSPGRFNPVGDKIRLRERGWEYDPMRRAWRIQVDNVRVYALTAAAALNISVVRIPTTEEPES